MEEKSRILKNVNNDKSRPVSFNDSFGGSENQLRFLFKYLPDKSFKNINLILNNANPDLIDYPIPSNDDAIRAIELMTKLVSQAIREGIAVSNVEQEFQQAAEASSPEASSPEASVIATEEIVNEGNEQQVQVESNSTEQ